MASLRIGSHTIDSSGCPRASRRALIAATAAVVMVLVTPAGAQVATLHCGDTLTHSTTLRRDLTGCSATALTIAADSVTLDLNGHTVSAGTADATAIDVTNHHDVSITAGTITGFDVGILIDGGARHHIRHVTITESSSFAILVLGSNHNEFTHNFAAHASDTDTDAGGVLLFQSAANTIADNTLIHNGDGIALVQSDHNRIRRNTSSHSGAGVVLVDTANDNLIAGNSLSDNTDSGVLLDDHADDNLIEDNVASANAFAGIAVGASDRNRVTHNTTNDNPGSGIAIVDNAHATVLERNQADRDGDAPLDCQPECPLLDDGIHVDAPGTLLTANTANDNADLGIDAVAGTLDGGNNTARGNGNPLQCTSVQCGHRPARTSHPNRSSGPTLTDNDDRGNAPSPPGRCAAAQSSSCPHRRPVNCQSGCHARRCPAGGTCGLIETVSGPYANSSSDRHGSRALKRQ